MRGFAVIALSTPKHDHNVGGAMRAAHCYGAGMIVYSGSRFRRQATDTTTAWRSIPLVRTVDVFDAIPHDCVPVAIDLVDGAISLVNYVHPERAFYVFGPEDGTLGEKTLSRCRDRVMVPTQYCMNLAATVNVILYDRMMKEYHR